MTQPAAVPASGDIVARVDFQYRWRSWAFAILMLMVGLWSLNDGFIVYPRDNAAWERMAGSVDRPPKPPHDQAGVVFNQFAGILCTAISIPFLVWRERRSRGEYRIAGNTLHAPGHGPVTFDQIRGLDLVRWDRKGVALVEYELATGGKRILKLCDMIYQRELTDQIVERIEAHLNALDAKQAAHTENTASSA
ncbi:MAG TPA: hypothetical protein VGI81_14350 [Tepidisphaeraceae bacterium]|jgi:hypothetical protein